ncbi:hypothetical protein BFP72_01020 [Reichenbachiella sp. 5M10]|nr:hypothetical protein BFP72_01020 [Reichenbachiella sp. 5M10]
MDVKHYRFEVKLSNESNLLHNRAAITVDVPEGMDTIRLDLANQMIIKKIEMEKRPVAFVHREDVVYIVVPRGMALARTVEIDIQYRGVPRDGLVISENKYGDRTFFTDHWPNRASQWLPVVDHPSEKATCEFIVEAPEEYSVISNGDLISVQAMVTGYKRTHWKIQQPIPPKVMAMGVAPFETQALDSASTAWLYRQTAEAGYTGFGDAPSVLAYLEGQIGAYPFDKADHVESTTRFGGMENASCIFYNEKEVRLGHGINALVAHELAHQWFGNSASEAVWEDVWLSEGFATYFQFMYIKDTYGLDSLKKVSLKSENKIQRYEDKYPGRTIIQTNYSTLNSLLNALSYDKAAWMLRALKHWIGEQQFAQLIQTYYARYSYSNARTEDFISVAEEVSGEDLGGFFYQWLRIPGGVDVRYNWKYRRGKLELNLEQKTKHVYHLKIDVPVVMSNNTIEVRQIELTERSQSFVLDHANVESNVVLDPLNIWYGSFTKE